MNRRNFLQGLLAAGVVTLVQPTFPVSMVAPAPKLSFEEIAKITLDKYRPILAANIMSGMHDNPFVIHKWKMSMSESEDIVEPIIYDRSFLNE